MCFVDPYLCLVQIKYTICWYISRPLCLHGITTLLLPLIQISFVLHLFYKLALNSNLKSKWVLLTITLLKKRKALSCIAELQQCTPSKGKNKPLCICNYCHWRWSAKLACVSVVAHEPFAGASSRVTFTAWDCAKKMKLQLQRQKRR